MNYTKYTWCYDKHGNKVKVYPPETSDGKKIKEIKTFTGTNIRESNIRKNGKL